MQVDMRDMIINTPESRKPIVAALLISVLHPGFNYITGVEYDSNLLNILIEVFRETSAELNRALVHLLVEQSYFDHPNFEGLIMQVAKMLEKKRRNSVSNVEFSRCDDIPTIKHAIAYGVDLVDLADPVVRRFVACCLANMSLADADAKAELEYGVIQSLHDVSVIDSLSTDMDKFKKMKADSLGDLVHNARSRQSHDGMMTVSLV